MEEWLKGLRDTWKWMNEMNERMKWTNERMKCLKEWKDEWMNDFCIEWWLNEWMKWKKYTELIHNYDNIVHVKVVINETNGQGQAPSWYSLHVHCLYISAIITCTKYSDRLEMVPSWLWTSVLILGWSKFHLLKSFGFWISKGPLNSVGMIFLRT